MKQKTKQKEKSREAITTSAVALLRERGINASSVMEVMKGAGLTVGGFYNHFDSNGLLTHQRLRGRESHIGAHSKKSCPASPVYSPSGK